MEGELLDDELSWFLVVMKFMEEIVRQVPVVAVLCAKDLAESCLRGVLPPVGNHPILYHLIHGYEQVFSSGIMVLHALHQIYSESKYFLSGQ